ncbi:MAG TPA: hypothetical protein VJN18_00455 [Polyangiaceae bacterium]|nr:hypothetical protein [Polyangiaceae bacterium]
MATSAALVVMTCVLGLYLAGCGDEEEAKPKTCDPGCQDQVAARSLRDVIKLVYNLTLQGNPVGIQDETTRCPHGGSARVSGVATSVAEQGANQLELGYGFESCAYQHLDDDAEESYDVVVSGIVLQTGVLAVQPTATTALIFESEAISVEGEIFDPPVAYAETECALRLAQDGQHLSGSWCGRQVGFDL